MPDGLLSRKRPAEEDLERVRRNPEPTDNATTSVEQPEDAPEDGTSPSLTLSLGIRWHSASGKTRSNSLPLTKLSTVSPLKGLSKDLYSTAYPELSVQPNQLASSEYVTFTPEEECLSLPGDVARTTFRLVANYDGWEYVVHERELGTGQGGTSRDIDNTLLVAVVEFESMAMIIGNFGIRLHLVAYPVISVKKTFLRDVEERLRTDPNFKGILS